MRVVREHGAAVVALTIDEAGPGPHPRPQGGGRRRGSSTRSPASGGCSVEDIIVDTLTFPIAHRPGGDAAATASRRSRRSASSSGATPTCRRRSGCPTSRSGSSRPPGRCSTRCSCTSASRPGWTRRSCTRPRSSRSPASREEQHDVALDLVYDRRRFAGDPARASVDLRPAAAVPRAVRGRGRRVAEGLPGRRAGRPAAGGAAGAAHHRRRAQGPRGRPARGARQGPQRARHHQRPPARRDARGRRAVRPGRDAAAVRAAVRRGDEGAGRATSSRTSRATPTAAPARPRPRSCWRPSRATCTTSARTSSTSSCPTTATTWSTSASSSRSPRSSGPPTSTTPTRSA